MKKKIEVEASELWHMLQIMKERGTGHCKECESIYKRLIEQLPPSMQLQS